MLSKIINDKNLKVLMDNIPACVFIKDATGHFVYVNRLCMELWQVDADEIIGTNGSNHLPPKQLQLLWASELKVFEGKVKVEHEELVWSPVHQENRNYRSTKMPLYDELGKPTYLIAVIEDITEHKRCEVHVKRITNLYKALLEVNQAILRLSDEQQLFPLICRCAVELCGMRMAWIGQSINSEQMILPVAQYGNNLDYIDQLVISTSDSVPEGLGPAGIAFRENRTVIVNNIDAEPMFNLWRNRIARYGWQSVAILPISRNKEPFALLFVYHDQKDTFDESIVSLLIDMTQDISFALDNFDRESQRKAAELANNLAALVYESSSEAMMVTNEDHIILSVNNAFSEITGYAKSEVIGQNGSILNAANHDDVFYHAISQQLQLNGKWCGEVWNKRKNAQIFPSRVTLNTVYGEDASVKYRVALFTDISQQKQDEEMIWRQGNLDALTGLPNRRMFHQCLEQEIRKSQRSGLPLLLLFLDLDDFKEVNDTLGHAMGDLLLKQASERLKECVREFDLIARLGGDEFTVILSEVDNLKGADRVISAILATIAEPYLLKDKQAFISVSIGVTHYPNDAADADTLLKNADQAMYAAKSGGRNQFSYFTPSMQEVAQKRMRMAADLRGALHGGQIWVAYQPILDLKTGHIVKAEALARWTHPAMGLIAPSEFIPIAEHTGLIIDIGQWIFEQAITQVKRWQEIYRDDFQVSINKSPVQIQNKKSRYESCAHQLSQAGLSGRSVVLEITEGLLVDANEAVSNKLLEYRDAGIQVALDDFGTGYSSLLYLKKFDIDYIKIDKAFVENLTAQSEDLALCEAMVLMAHKLGIKVIAEGVATEEQQELLIGAGCDYAQGHWFSEALEAEDFEKLLMKSAGLRNNAWPIS